jgi:hypothetical protein
MKMAAISGLLCSLQAITLPTETTNLQCLFEREYNKVSTFSHLPATSGNSKRDVDLFQDTQANLTKKKT